MEGFNEMFQEAYDEINSSQTIDSSSSGQETNISSSSGQKTNTSSSKRSHDNDDKGNSQSSKRQAQ